MFLSEEGTLRKLLLFSWLTFLIFVSQRGGGRVGASSEEDVLGKFAQDGAISQDDKNARLGEDARVNDKIPETFSEIPLNGINFQIFPHQSKIKPKEKKGENDGFLRRTFLKFCSLFSLFSITDGTKHDSETPKNGEKTGDRLNKESEELEQGNISIQPPKKEEEGSEREENRLENELYGENGDDEKETLRFSAIAPRDFLEKLIERGFLAPDGASDDLSAQEAILDFQMVFGIPATGEHDEATRQMADRVFGIPATGEHDEATRQLADRYHSAGRGEEIHRRVRRQATTTIGSTMTTTPEDTTTTETPTTATATTTPTTTTPTTTTPTTTTVAATTTTETATTATVAATTTTPGPPVVTITAIVIGILIIIGSLLALCGALYVYTPRVVVPPPPPPLFQGNAILRMTPVYRSRLPLQRQILRRPPQRWLPRLRPQRWLPRRPQRWLPRRPQRWLPRRPQPLPQQQQPRWPQQRRQQWPQQQRQQWPQQRPLPALPPHPFWR